MLLFAHSRGSFRAGKQKEAASHSSVLVAQRSRDTKPVSPPAECSAGARPSPMRSTHFAYAGSSSCRHTVRSRHEKDAQEEDARTLAATIACRDAL
eukprot:872800-Pyramimonas_sp.AAC.1